MSLAMLITMEKFMDDAMMSLMGGYLEKARRGTNVLNYVPSFNSASCQNSSRSIHPVPSVRSRIETFESDSDDETPAYHLNSKRVPTQALSSFGLKLVPSNIPKKSSRKLRKSEALPVKPLNRNITSSPHQVKPSSESVHHKVIHAPSSPISSDSASKRFRHISKENSCKELPPSKTKAVDFSMLTITVHGPKGVKVSEIMTDLKDYQRIRRIYPKLIDVLPGVDEKSKEQKFSADAVKAVLGFIFSPSFNFSSIKSDVTSVEILAIIRSWEILKFHSFQEHFLKNTLNERNAPKIFSLAQHFGLEAIKEACLELCKEPVVREHKEKVCTVSVCTYVDPLELCIPLEPISENWQESFDRDILNDLLFESLSSTFVITGIEIRLNTETGDTGQKIQIHYSTESSSEELCIQQRTVWKQLGPTIIINFKKNLEVSVGKKVKISLEINTKPCLCSIVADEIMKMTDAQITISSNRKAQFSDKSLFVISKIYYLKASIN